MHADIQRIEKGPLVCWQIRRGDAELLVAEQGAQILSYREGDAPPIIWLSEQAAFEAGQSLRGGVPVCWPWFGDLRRNPAKVQAMYAGEGAAPAHGLVRAIDWTLATQDADDASLEFVCPQAREGLPGWPHPLDLRLRVSLADGLQIELSSGNPGDQPVAFSQALHSYFAVSDIREVAVEGLGGRRYIETLEDWQEREQQGELRFAGETDRIYLGLPPTLSLLDAGWQRRISLHASGSRSAVLWNPWIDKAQRLSQFADDAWQRMLCIETANVLDDCVVLQPGETHRLLLRIAAEAL
jgi:glucose-6-phosphate 1-epimerase